MTTYARIQNGAVAELFTTTGDITTMFNPALVWVPVGTSGAQVGWTYSNGAFAAPPSLPALTKPQLIAYAGAKVTALLAVARTYALGSGVSVKCDATTPTGADLAGLNAWGTATPAATTTWVDDFGVPTTITGAQGVALAAGVIAYGQSVYDELGVAATGVAGSTITTTAQIDALTWPT
jgi:hypothetical protein